MTSQKVIHFNAFRLKQTTFINLLLKNTAMLSRVGLHFHSLVTIFGDRLSIDTYLSDLCKKSELQLNKF